MVVREFKQWVMMETKNDSAKQEEYGVKERGCT